MNCHLCSATFSRSEHLSRHIMAHKGERLFRCQFCDKTFSRRDVLVRHWTSCKRRIQLGHQLRSPTLGQKRKPRRACDRCVRSKLACDCDNPCSSCLKRNVECGYELASRSRDHVSPTNSMPETCENSSAPESIVQASPPGFDFEEFVDTTKLLDDSISPHRETPMFEPTASGDNYNLKSTAIVSAPPATTYVNRQRIERIPSGLRGFERSSLYTLDYLANFTSTTGFVNSFECGSWFQRREISSLLKQNKFPLPIVGHDFQNKRLSIMAPSYELPSNSQHATFPTERVDVFSSFSTDRWNIDDFIEIPTTPHYVDDFSDSSAPDALTLKCRDIVLAIKSVVSRKTKASVIMIDWSTSVEQSCAEYFKPQNVHKFLAWYWSCWHSNCPIIHKPTFDPSSATPGLLAAMMLIGACLSPPEVDSENASMWFDCVEDLVFSNESTLDDSPRVSPGPSIDESVKSQQCEALQAAFLVCLYQYWEGSNKSKQRARRHRYSIVVAMARDMDMSSAKQRKLQIEEASNFDWQGFALREQIIRTMNYVFLLDAGFFIYHNMPPRLSLRELQMDLPCPEICFQAESSKECFENLRRWQLGPSRTSLSVAQAMTFFSRKELPPDIWSELLQLSTLSWFVVASALHVFNFQLQSTLEFEPNFGPLRQAIKNWSLLWAKRSTLEAPEFDLAYERLISGDLPPQDSWKRMGFMRHAPEFCLLAKLLVQRLEKSRHREDEILREDTNNASAQESKASDLTKFDNPTMQQINQIITSFQVLDLNQPSTTDQLWI